MKVTVLYDLERDNSYLDQASEVPKNHKHELLKLQSDISLAQMILPPPLITSPVWREFMSKWERFIMEAIDKEFQKRWVPLNKNLFVNLTRRWGAFQIEYYDANDDDYSKIKVVTNPYPYIQGEIPSPENMNRIVTEIISFLKELKTQSGKSKNTIV